MRVIPVLLLVVGCAETGSSSVESELDATLRALGAGVEVFGCADVEVVAANSADSRGLVVRVDDDIAADALLAGATVGAEYTLPDPAVEITAMWGSDVTIDHCNDVSYGTVVDGEASAISGVLSIEVVPDGFGTELMPTGRAKLLLEDVVFETTAGEQRDLDELELSDVYVGWLPG